VPKFRQNEKNQNKKEYYFVILLPFFLQGKKSSNFGKFFFFEDFSSHLDNSDYSSVAIFFKLVLLVFRQVLNTYSHLMLNTSSDASQ
jgi:hypothetical protein